ncbi:MAG TPA: penicillin-binding protein 2 [Ruminiclostridium sp.]|nr:penicillin-binding protein 2 [Ruminiclostridium sp.]
MKQFFKDRYTIVGIAIVLMFSVIVYQLANIQLVQGQNYLTQSQSKIMRSTTILAERGNILDRNGVPIAINSTSYSIMLMDTGLGSEKLNTMMYKISKVLEKNGDSYNKAFSKYITYPVAFGSMLAKNPNRQKTLVTMTGYPFKGFNQDSTPEEVYEYCKDKIFKIDDKYSDQDAYKIMTLRFAGISMTPVLADSISTKTIAELEERSDEFPGITINSVPSRKYVDANVAGQLIGHVGAISADELAKHRDEGYNLTDIIGKSGVELTAEGYLRGTNGYRRVEVDDSGKTRTVNEEAVKPGSDVVLTIDMGLQKAAMDSLARNIKLIRQSNSTNNHHDAFAGAAVAVDVNTGEVLALASYPSYDPSIFIANPDDKAAQKAKAALADPKNTTTSEYNRAIAGTYTPGSTFKPLVGIAALQEGATTPYATYFDKGYEIFDGLMLKSIEYNEYHGGLGTVNLISAIQKSSNPYFYNLGNKVGIDNIVKWAKRFGLGQKTGIDLLGESKGIVSSRDYKKKINPYPWTAADTAQSSIGQMYNSFTPMQLANYAATIANGGRHFKPHIIKRVVKYDGSIVTETKPEYEMIPVKMQNMDAIQEGMIAVANSEDGTAANIFKDLKPIEVAGKTGTAETGQEANHSSNALFICYAPADKPQIAVAVVVERGVFGAYTAPIAKDILKYYFDSNGSGNKDYTVKSDVVQLTK